MFYLIFFIEYIKNVSFNYASLSDAHVAQKYQFILYTICNELRRLYYLMFSTTHSFVVKKIKNYEINLIWNQEVKEIIRINTN